MITGSLISITSSFRYSTTKYKDKETWFIDDTWHMGRDQRFCFHPNPHMLVHCIFLKRRNTPGLWMLVHCVTVNTCIGFFYFSVVYSGVWSSSISALTSWVSSWTNKHALNSLWQTDPKFQVRNGLYRMNAEEIISIDCTNQNVPSKKAQNCYERSA